MSTPPARQMLAISIKDRSGDTTLSRGRNDRRDCCDTQMKRLSSDSSEDPAQKYLNNLTVCMHALYEFPDSCTNKLTGVNDV